MGDQRLPGREPGHHRHLDVGEQAAQGGHARRPEGPGPVDEGLPPGGGGLRRMACIETAKGSARTAISSDTASGTGISIESWAARSSAHAPGASVVTPTWTPGPSLPAVKFAQAQVPGGTGGAGGSMPRGPQVSHGLSTTLSRPPPPGLGTEFHHLGHHLVSRDVGQRREGGHGVVDVAFAEVPHDELGVGSADPRQDGSGHHPVGSDLRASSMTCSRKAGRAESGRGRRPVPVAISSGSGGAPKTSAFIVTPSRRRPPSVTAGT